MADITVRRSHGLSLAEAQAKIDQVVDDIQNEFPNLVNSVDWNTEKTSARVEGKGFTGDFRVDDDEVGIDVDLSLFAKPLKGKVQKKIEERIEQYFA